jgi:hypothetical protein
MLKIADSSAIVPSDPFITRRNPPGSAGKLHTPQNATLPGMTIDQVSQMRPIRHGVSKIVVPTHQLAKESAPLIGLDQFPLQPSDIPRRSLNHRAGIAFLRYRHCRPAPHRSPSPFIGQLEQSSSLQLL